MLCLMSAPAWQPTHQHGAQDSTTPAAPGGSRCLEGDVVVLLKVAGVLTATLSGSKSALAV